ncbi:MAG: tetratricopeptide repeat protein, partial [Deltaproteobacteria bacterium]|nr:tetratricopeptide repeat protein [Deltaproteobacteria bacterium]
MLGFVAVKVWRIAPIAVFLCLVQCGSEAPVEHPPEFINAMNRGKAYLENQDPTMAVQAFEEAVAHAPNSAPALRNLARAHFMALDLASFAEVLERARALEPDSIATHYLSGLRHTRLGEFEQAIPHFEEAV